MLGGLQHHQTPLDDDVSSPVSALARASFATLFLDDFGFALTARVFGRVLRLAGQALFTHTRFDVLFRRRRGRGHRCKAVSAFGVSFAASGDGVFAV